MNSLLDTNKNTKTPQKGKCKLFISFSKDNYFFIFLLYICRYIVSIYWLVYYKTVSFVFAWYEDKESLQLK